MPQTDGNTVAVALRSATADLTGLVSDHRGLSVPDAPVLVWQSGYGLRGETRTGPAGTWVVRGLPVPGPYTVQVAPAGYQPLQAQVDSLPAGVRTRVDLAAVPGARVELLRQNWGVLAAAQTGADGQFSLQAPPAANAEYRVRVRAYPAYYTGWAPATSGWFSLPSAGPRAVELTAGRSEKSLSSNRWLTGLVADAAGVPVPAGARPAPAGSAPGAAAKRRRGAPPECTSGWAPRAGSGPAGCRHVPDQLGHFPHGAAVAAANDQHALGVRVPVGGPALMVAKNCLYPDDFTAVFMS